MNVPNYVQMGSHHSHCTVRLSLFRPKFAADKPADIWDAIDHRKVGLRNFDTSITLLDMQKTMGCHSDALRQFGALAINLGSASPGHVSEWP